jgi:hypothetical protein
MTALATAFAVWGACEIGWAIVPALRPMRPLLRLYLLLFLLLTTAVYVGTVTGALPERLHYGRGILRYASDSVTYQSQATAVAAALRQGALDVLADRQQSAYATLLGLLFAVVGPDPLAAMVLNGMFYSATVACVFLIGREIYGARVATWALAAASLWPGFLLHTVQTLRGVGTTLGVMMVVLSCVSILGRNPGARPLMVGVAGYGLLLADLPYMAGIVAALVVLWAGALVLGSVRQRELVRSALVMALLGATTGMSFYGLYGNSVSRAVRSVDRPAADAFSVAGSDGAGRHEVTSDRAQAPVALHDAVVVPAPVALLLASRDGFQLANAEGTTGTGIAARKLETGTDLLWNVPIAIRNAAFAPAPNTLLSGEPGTSGLRQFVAIEFVPYVLATATALVGLLASLSGTFGLAARRQSAFVTLLVVTVYTLQGTVVLNGGTLYRMRLPYVLLLFVFAAYGYQWLSSRRRGPSAEAML